MRIAIAGAHGQVARRLGALLADGGDTVVGVVRNPDHRSGLEAAGVDPVVLDLESATVADVAGAVSGSDAVVFAAGAGPGSGVARKDTVDRAAATLLADAAERTGVRRFVLVSSMGVDAVRKGATPDGMDETFAAYLRAKLAAEDDLMTRDLDWTVLRPGGLTDDPGTGRVALAERVDRGLIPRDDVAAVIVALLRELASARQVLEVVGGNTPVDAAVRRVISIF
jgi:nucleoside-diphosphate-sugar epimerase